MAKPNGVIVYEGPSELDGEPIVVIVTGLKRTSNRKTGSMLQSWILLQNTPPVDAVNNDLDGSVCGDCKHRRWKTCYVNTGQAPYNVYAAYKRGSYPKMDINTIYDVEDRTLRMGSYGDPAAVPQKVWKVINNSVKGITGYTHQWKSKSNNYLADYCMASVDTKKEAIQAQSLGWRTFRIVAENEELLENEHFCPAKDGETTCDKCMSCNGLQGENRKNPVILPHGANFRRYLEITRLRNQKKKFMHLV